MSNSKQAEIQAVVTHSIIKFFLKEKLCTSELRIQGTLCITADNSSVFTTQISDNVFSKSLQNEGLYSSENLYDSNTYPETLSNDGTSSRSDELPLKYFYKNSDFEGNTLITKSKSSDNKTPSMFGKKRQCKSTNILSNLLQTPSSHGHKPVLSSICQSQTSGSSNITVDLGLRNSSEDSPVNCLYIPSRNSTVPIDLSVSNFYTKDGPLTSTDKLYSRSFTPTPYSIISPNAPNLHNSLNVPPTKNLQSILNEAPTDTNLWLSKSPKPSHNMGTNNGYTLPVVSPEDSTIQEGAKEHTTQQVTPGLYWSLPQTNTYSQFNNLLRAFML